MTIPLIILGGSDRRPGYLPPRSRDNHPLTGCKGADVRLGGKRLIEAVADRYLKVPDVFGPLYVAGPAAAYAAEPLDLELFDTDGDFGDNIQVGIEEGRRRHPVGPIAMTTCDVLPEEADLRRVLADYREHAPSDLWFPVIRSPRDQRALGASSWKPRYVLVSERSEEVPVLPSHLAIFEPEAMRLAFCYRLLQGAYSTRNRPVRYRSWVMVRRLIFAILIEDWTEIRALRLPTATVEILSCLVAARRLAHGTLSQPDLERYIRRLFVHRTHRRRFPERRTRLPILEGLSLARDIDTVEEARAFGATAVPAGLARS